MKIFNTFLNVFIALTIFLQSQAKAETILLPNSPEVVASVLDSYNSLSQEERLNRINLMIEQAPEKDQKFISLYQEDLKRVHWPDLQYEDEKFSFLAEGAKVEFEFRNNIMRLKGATILILSGELEKSFKHIEKALGKKEFSLLSFFIASAYALPIILLAIICIAISAFVLAPAFSKINTTIAKLQCHKILKELDDYESQSFSSARADDLLSKVRKILEQSDRGWASEKCAYRPQKNPAHCKELSDNKKCYEFVQREVEQRFTGSVNQSDRSWGVKEFIFGTIPKAKGVPARAE